jgi:hypothetical protein
MDDGDLRSRKSPNSVLRNHSAGQHTSTEDQLLVAVVIAVILVVIAVVIMMVVVAVILMVVVVPAIVTIAAVLVPLVIVINVAVIPVPVSCIKLLSIVVRSNPSSPLIGRSRPIPVMPPIVISDWIPITVDIRVTGTRVPRYNANHTGTWRRTNSNAERDLRVRYRCAGQQQDDE